MPALETAKSSDEDLPGLENTSVENTTAAINGSDTDTLADGVDDQTPLQAMGMTEEVKKPASGDDVEEGDEDWDMDDVGWGEKEADKKEDLSDAFGFSGPAKSEEVPEEEEKKESALESLQRRHREQSD